MKIKVRSHGNAIRGVAMAVVKAMAALVRKSLSGAWRRLDDTFHMRLGLLHD